MLSITAIISQFLGRGDSSQTASWTPHQGGSATLMLKWYPLLAEILKKENFRNAVIEDVELPTWEKVNFPSDEPSSIMSDISNYSEISLGSCAGGNPKFREPFFWKEEGAHNVFIFEPSETGLSILYNQDKDPVCLNYAQEGIGAYWDYILRLTEKYNENGVFILPIIEKSSQMNAPSHAVTLFVQYDSVSKTYSPILVDSISREGIQASFVNLVQWRSVDSSAAKLRSFFRAAAEKTGASCKELSLKGLGTQSRLDKNCVTWSFCIIAEVSKLLLSGNSLNGAIEQILSMKPSDIQKKDILDGLVSIANNPEITSEEVKKTLALFKSASVESDKIDSSISDGAKDLLPISDTVSDESPGFLPQASATKKKEVIELFYSSEKGLRISFESEKRFLELFKYLDTRVNVERAAEDRSFYVKQLDAPQKGGLFVAEDGSIGMTFIKESHLLTFLKGVGLSMPSEQSDGSLIKRSHPMSGRDSELSFVFKKEMISEDSTPLRISKKKK